MFADGLGCPSAFYSIILTACERNHLVVLTPFSVNFSSNFLSTLLKQILFRDFQISSCPGSPTPSEVGQKAAEFRRLNVLTGTTKLWSRDVVLHINFSCFPISVMPILSTVLFQNNIYAWVRSSKLELSTHELILLPYFIATDFFFLPAWAYVGGNIH